MVCVLKVHLSSVPQIPSIRAIPLQILSVDSTGCVCVNHEVLLHEREQFTALDPAKPFKINAGTTGYCEFVQPFNL
jgi:aminopeptidase 2